MVVMQKKNTLIELIFITETMGKDAHIILDIKLVMGILLQIVFQSFQRNFISSKIKKLLLKQSSGHLIKKFGGFVKQIKYMNGLQPLALGLDKRQGVLSAQILKCLMKIILL